MDTASPKTTRKETNAKNKKERGCATRNYPQVSRNEAPVFLGIQRSYFSSRSSAVLISCGRMCFTREKQRGRPPPLMPSDTMHRTFTPFSPQPPPSPLSVNPRVRTARVCGSNGKRKEGGGKRSDHAELEHGALYREGKKRTMRIRSRTRKIQVRPSSKSTMRGLVG